MTELNNSTGASEDAITDTKEGVALFEETETLQKDEEPKGIQEREEERKENSTKKETGAVYTSCLTIQPNRVLCGVRAHKSWNLAKNSSSYV